MHIAFLDHGTLPPRTVLRTPSFPHSWHLYERTDPGDRVHRIQDADIVIVNKVPLDAETLSAARRLRLVAVAATGTDIVDIRACAELGIVVSNIREYAITTVPEHTFALLFALRRSICAYQNAVRNGRWQAVGQFCFFDHPIGDIAGTTLGIIGDGAIGRAVGRIGTALGMNVLYAAYKGRTDMGVLYTPFDDVMARSDVITLHCPLLPATRQMMAAREFAAMQRKPLLINTARGGLVDEQALAEALAAGQIAGAAFDVVTEEPPAPDHPFMKLTERPNFILTPHVAWASDSATQALADQLMDNIEAFQRGQPVNVVEPDSSALGHAE